MASAINSGSAPKQYASAADLLRLLFLIDRRLRFMTPARLKHWPNAFVQPFEIDVVSLAETGDLVVLEPQDWLISTS